MTSSTTSMPRRAVGTATVELIRSQARLYPVTNADFGTDFSEAFAEGPWQTRKRMQWFWDAYLTAAGNPGIVTRLAAGPGYHRRGGRAS